MLCAFLVHILIRYNNIMSLKTFRKVTVAVAVAVSSHTVRSKLHCKCKKLIIQGIFDPPGADKAKLTFIVLTLVFKMSANQIIWCEIINLLSFAESAVF